jgi:RHS repeat-associated protein
MNRLLSATDALNQITSHAYDVEGNQTALTDARGNAYIWSYDLLNRNTQMLYPDSSTEQWTYDAVGNRLTSKTRAGQVMTCTFDARNRETQSLWSDATPGIARVFDNAGRLISSSNGVATRSYSYDTANRQLSETQTIAALNQSYTVGYAYDADGNRSSLTQPSGTVVNYTYTGRNQMKEVVADGPPPLATYVYNPDGTRASRTLENGTVSLYGYDNANQLLSVLHRNGAVPQQRFDYAYDSVGRRTSMQVNSNKWDTYSYDAIDQVKGVKYAATAASGTGAVRNVSYSYDAVGNRQQVTDNSVATNYSVANVVNQYNNVGAGNVLYDANGNLNRMERGVPSAADAYSYDAQNRLTTSTSGTNTVQISYDTRNRQVSRTVNGAVTYFVWDGWSLIEERDASGQIVQQYIHGADVDEILSKSTGTGSVYYQQDGLGSVTGLTDITGQLVESYSYDVYGAVTILDSSLNLLPSSLVGNRFLYTGREWMAEAGLYDYRNRVYSVELGRFLQTDPIRFRAADVNVYRYVGNDVVLRNDPTGEFANVIGGAIGGGIIGAIGGAIGGYATGGWEGAAMGAVTGGIGGVVGGAIVGATGNIAAGAAVAGAISGALDSGLSALGAGGNASAVASAALIGGGVGATIGYIAPGQTAFLGSAGSEIASGLITGIVGGMTGGLGTIMGSACK